MNENSDLRERAREWFADHPSDGLVTVGANALIRDLHATLAEAEKDLEFAFKRAMVLANMLNIPVHESPAVTGTILGMVRRKVEELLEAKS